MAHLILIGKRANVSEVIKLADRGDTASINEITKLKKKICTDGKYKDFTSIEIWNPQTGRGFARKLREAETGVAAVSKERSAENQKALDEAIALVGEEVFLDYEKLAALDPDKLKEVINKRIADYEKEEEPEKPAAKPRSNAKPKR